MHTVADLIRRNRMLWGGVAWVTSLLMAGFGGTYLIGGVHVSAAPQTFEILTRDLPGGVHTYGGVLLAPALAVIHGLIAAAHPGHSMLDKFLHKALLFVIVIAACAAVMFALSWIDSGNPAWGGILVWTAVACFALLLWRCPPLSPPDQPRAA